MWVERARTRARSMSGEDYVEKSTSRQIHGPAGTPKAGGVSQQTEKPRVKVGSGRDCKESPSELWLRTTKVHFMVSYLGICIFFVYFVTTLINRMLYPSLNSGLGVPKPPPHCIPAEMHAFSCSARRGDRFLGFVDTPNLNYL